MALTFRTPELSLPVYPVGSLFHMATQHEKWALPLAYFACAVALGVHPHDRAAWALESVAPLVEVLAIIYCLRWRGLEFTRLCYYLVFIHVVIQLIGGHYTYAEVPLFNWLRDYFHWQRNHYDRLAHFAVGFCLYNPIREICLRRTPLKTAPRWAAFFSFTTITAIAGLWEVWEWIVAAGAYSDLGAAYLGTQGDPWDAQKDIALSPIGAIAAALLFTAAHDRALKRCESEDKI